MTSCCNILDSCHFNGSIVVRHMGLLSVICWLDNEHDIFLEFNGGLRRNCDVARTTQQLPEDTTPVCTKCKARCKRGAAEQFSRIKERQLELFRELLNLMAQ